MHRRGFFEEGLAVPPAWLGSDCGSPTAHHKDRRRINRSRGRPGGAGLPFAAENSAREHTLRLVVKGGGHSYQDTATAPDSLLIWTRHMDRVTLHDAFVAKGCEGKQSPQPAVSVGSGAMWRDAYAAVTTQAG